MAKPKPALSISFRNRQISLDGRCLRLTKRFFNLYCYLAVMRLSDPVGDGGYTSCEQIHNLQAWTRNTSASVGKQISRHVLKMKTAKCNLIESEQKVGGPFRLALPGSRIKMDVPTEIVLKHFSLPPLGKAKTGDWEPKAARSFTEQYWRGVSNFNDGQLSKALRQFRSALDGAVSPHHWLASSFHIQQILERRGDAEEARKLRLEGSKRLKEAGRYHLWAEAKNAALAAWSDYREGRLDVAETAYLKVLAMIQDHGLLDVLGQVHNGLAGIEKNRGHYPEAMAYYLEALNAWLLADYFYGFQAIYFNIAVIQRDWGDSLAKQDLEAAAKEKYETAREWAEACLALCKGMAIGDDTADLCRVPSRYCCRTLHGPVDHFANHG
jgi:tetratricopeptide (TPR) repeat protein